MCSDPIAIACSWPWGDRIMFRRLLNAKNVVLWLLITPLCSVVALVNGLVHHNLSSTALTIVWIGIVPFGALGLSNLVGIRFPYHPMPLRFPRQHRRPFWRMIGRWSTLAVTPYILVPLLCVLLMVPTLTLWGLLTPHGLNKQLHVSDCGGGSRWHAWWRSPAGGVVIASAFGSPGDGQRVWSTFSPIRRVDSDWGQFEATGRQLPRCHATLWVPS
jgi:hypothetical protein